MSPSTDRTAKARPRAHAGKKADAAVPSSPAAEPLDEHEERWRRLGEFIRQQRNQAELSVRRLSDLSGVSNPYLSQIERGLKKPSAEILMQIAKALSIAPPALYRAAGLLDSDIESADETSPAGVVEAIRLDPALTEDQKTSLIQVYESFVRTR